MTPPFLTSPRLLCAPKVAHGFFSRAGGVSKGIYASLNTGGGSRDHIGDIAENRRRCAEALGVSPEALLTNNQCHSADVLTVTAPWRRPPAPADALVTKERGLALGVLAADCMPWLMLEPEARVIGAVHAGWRGALAGVLENAVGAMEELGAERGRIIAALGPCLRQHNFEVGLELVAAFEARRPQSTRFFSPGPNAAKRRLDLAGFAVWRLACAGVTKVDDAGLCTLGANADYFSYRASKRRGERDYGRNLSAIVLA